MHVAGCRHRPTRGGGGGGGLGRGEIWNGKICHNNFAEPLGTTKVYQVLPWHFDIHHQTPAPTATLNMHRTSAAVMYCGKGIAEGG